MPLGPLNVVSGENGTGKSNLHRALRLLADTARGDVVASLAREGGLASTLWAGPEASTSVERREGLPVQGTVRQERVNLRLGFSTKDLSYSIDLGLPTLDRKVSAFANDPEIKRECIWAGPFFRPASLLVDRRGPIVKSKAQGSGWDIIESNLASYHSMLARVSEPRRAPEILTMREQILSWRFYDHFRSDPDAPARQPQLGTRTLALSDDGHDLAAALQTIREIGDEVALAEAVSAAFPGSELRILAGDGRFGLDLKQHGLLRPLSSAELSDGTLRYLLWVAALLTPRPPALMVLNEPETSLHPDLFPALAALIAHAAKRTQVWIVSHSEALIAALKKERRCKSIVLTKKLGETQVLGQKRLERPIWHWPER